MRHGGGGGTGGTLAGRRTPSQATAGAYNRTAGRPWCQNPTCSAANGTAGSAARVIRL